MKDTDIRADHLALGDVYAEVSDEDPITITQIALHGDSIVIWGKCDGDTIETTLDRDTVVWLYSRKARE